MREANAIATSHDCDITIQNTVCKAGHGGSRTKRKLVGGRPQRGNVPLDWPTYVIIQITEVLIYPSCKTNRASLMSHRACFPACQIGGVHR